MKLSICIPTLIAGLCCAGHSNRLMRDLVLVGIFPGRMIQPELMSQQILAQLAWNW